MDESLDIPGLLQRRKLTRPIADLLGERLAAFLSALAPLFDPRTVFGEHIRGTTTKSSPKGADAAFQDLRAAYLALAPFRKFDLEPELNPPLDVFGTLPEARPAEYLHEATSGGETRSIRVVSPLRWTLSYRNQGPGRLDHLLSSASGGSKDEVRICVLHQLVMHAVASRRPGVATLLEGLRFPVSSRKAVGLGGLPVMEIAAPIGTSLPSDDILIQSTDLSGSETFEEIVDPRDLPRLADPLREELLALAREHLPEFPPEDGAP